MPQDVETAAAGEIEQLAQMVRDGNRAELALLPLMFGAWCEMNYLHNALSKLQPQDGKRLKIEDVMGQMHAAAKAVVEQLDRLCGSTRS